MYICDLMFCENSMPIILDDNNLTMQNFDFSPYSCIPVPLSPVVDTYYTFPWYSSHMENLSPRSAMQSTPKSVETIYSDNILMSTKTNFNQKQLSVAKIYKKLKSEFTDRKKLVQKINIDENGLALRLFGHSAQHVKSLSRALFYFDNEVEIEEVSIYINRRKNYYIKGITIYMKIKNKDDKEKIFDICKRYDLKVTFLGKSNPKD
jgi:hypothetical protein